MNIKDHNRSTVSFLLSLPSAVILRDTFFMREDDLPSISQLFLHPPSPPGFVSSIQRQQH